MSTQPEIPSPSLIFNAAHAYHQSAALKAALELDVFSALGQGSKEASELAQQCGTSLRGIRILCDYLVVIGFLKKDAFRYRLTPDSAMFLDRHSPAYIGSSIELLLAPLFVSGFNHLTAAVRKGGTALPEDGSLAPDHPVWVLFAQKMAPLMAQPAQLIAQLVDKLLRS